MKTIELTAHVDEHHRLTAEVPAAVPPGAVRVLLVLASADEDEAGAAWMQGIAHEWAAELSDPREDIYTLEDGEPLDGAR
jgi:hypothetical protein